MKYFISSIHYIKKKTLIWWHNTEQWKTLLKWYPINILESLVLVATTLYMQESLPQTDSLSVFEKLNKNNTLSCFDLLLSSNTISIYEILKSQDTLTPLNYSMSGTLYLYKLTRSLWYTRTSEILAMMTHYKKENFTPIFINYMWITFMFWLINFF